MRETPAGSKEGQAWILIRPCDPCPELVSYPLNVLYNEMFWEKTMKTLRSRSVSGANKLVALYGLVFAMVLLLSLPVQAQGAWLDAAWSDRSTVVVNNPGGTTLTDFQVHIVLDSSFDFTKAKSDGSDVRLTSDDGTTLVPFWIEKWDSANKSASLWVKVPSIAAVGSATLYLYYGNASAVSASNGSATFEFFDDFESGTTGTTVPGYYRLGNPQTVLAQDQSWEDSAPHTLSVIENNSGGYTYWGYYGLQAGCGGVGLAYSDDLVTWTKYSGNPLFLNGRWPSVQKVGNTYYMLYTKDFCATSYINLAESSDGINFSDVKTIVQPLSGFANQNPNLFHNPNDGKYYLYWYHGAGTTLWEIHVRSAATPEGLDDPGSEAVVLRSDTTLAAPNMLFRDGTYFLSTEGLDSSGQWVVLIYTSNSPTSGFSLLPGNPVLANGSACNFQHVVGTELHDYYCKLTGNTWTVDHRVADLTAGRLQFQEQAIDPNKWTASGGSWNSVIDIQQDGTMGNVVQGSIGSSVRQVLISSYQGGDYVLDAYGKLLSGRVWGLGARALDLNNLYTVNLYEDLNSTNNLYVYNWINGSGATLASTAVGAVNPDTWYKLTVKAHGNLIDVYKDDVLMMQTSSSQFGTGAVALYGEQNTAAEFNNVRVRNYASVEPSATVTSGGAVPVIDSLAPTSASAGGSDFTLTVNGSGFVPDSAVQWNGTSRTTTFVSAIQLSAAITAADIATEGTATVTVSNPAPGGGISNAKTFLINNPQAGTWTQTDWVGGGGQSIWADSTRYSSASGIDNSINGQIGLATTSSVLFSDDFTRSGGDPLSPWLVPMGTWTVTGGVMQGSGSPLEYSYAYISTTPQWTDYRVQGRIQMPAGSFGGGIGGRVDPATGAHYGAWVYPAGSPGGSNLLQLWKFRGWTDINGGPYDGVPMQQVSLPDVGTGWHTLQMTFMGNRILVYYDGVLKIDVTDNNYDSRPPYLSGGISVDWWTWDPPYTITVDDISVITLPAYGSSGVLLSSAYDGGDGAQWQAVSWDATAGGGTNVCVQTRTADSSDQLANASWSDCYSTSGSGLMSANRRWIQYQLGLTTSDPSSSPVLTEIRIPFLSGTSGAPIPVINSLSPASAAAGGSAFTLTVNGSGFVTSSAVRWNGANRTTTYVSSTQLTATISTADIAAAGTAQVTVFNPAPGGGTSNAQTFTINAINNPVPAITSISPTSAPAGGAAFTLTVNGTSFVSSSAVQWNGSNRTTTYVSSTQLTATISAADIAAAGTASVTVFNPAPGGGTSNAQTFTINSPAPTTTSLSPSSTTAGGTAFALTVNGTGFVANSIVQWNGSSRTTTYVSSTRLTATIPASDIAVAGTASVTVFTPAPGGGTSNAQTFTITTINNPVPTTSSLSPTSTTAGGPDFVLTVNGSNFVAGSVVRWKGANRTTTYVSPTQLTAAISAADIAAAGTASVTVFNPAPGGGTSSGRTFTINNPVPTTTGLSPASATAGGLAFTLTVNGTGFVAGSRVRWNGANRTTTFVSSTQLTANIPASNIRRAGTAQVTVFNPTPGGGTSNGQTFTIN